MQPTDPSKFTEKAWEAVVKSQDVARRFKHQQLEVEHVAIALLDLEGTANTMLLKAGLEPIRLKQQIEAFAQRQPRVPDENGQLYLGQGLDTLLDNAEFSRNSMQDDFISVEHLLLALSEDDRVGRRVYSNHLMSMFASWKPLSKRCGVAKRSKIKPPNRAMLPWKNMGAT